MEELMRTKQEEDARREHLKPRIAPRERD